MNLTQLKYFEAVCTHGKVSNAALALNISQPSVSNAIKELEQEFGVTLFHRHYSGMHLTPEGETLLKMSRDLISRAEQIEHIMADMGNDRKTLRLGVPPMIGALVMPHIYSKFQTKHPDIRLEITESGREELLKKLSDDFLDMIFIPHNGILSKELSSKHIAKLEIVCCASADNPISLKKTITADDLADTPLVLFKNSFFQTEQIKKWFSLSSVKINVLLQTEQLSTVQSLISNNMAVGFMFKDLTKADDNFIAISLSEPMYADVSLVWKTNSYMLGSMKKFKNFISDYRLFNG